jgi:predicted Zn-dependent protease
MLAKIVFTTLLAAPVLVGQKVPKIPLPGRTNKTPAPGKVVFDRTFYENLRNFADGLYNQKERQDFRITVDRQYEEILRAHADRAFKVNTSPHSEVKVILEDRFRFFTGLYDNLMIQDLVNSIGQQVAPSWSDKLITFKLIADPVPRAEALATGTVYITTGLAAALDNKAQLAYVLAHEAAHVAKEHWRSRVLMENAKIEYTKQKEENARGMELYGSLVGLGAGAITGAVAGRSPAATAVGAVVGAATGYVVGSGFMGDNRLNMDWNEFEEDEADEVALNTMIEAKLDVKEVPTLYAALDKMSMKDDRVGMGFWGNRPRMQERLEVINEFLKKVPGSTALTGNDPAFRRLIAELKRDNGILSYHYDMLEVARANLEQAVDVRQADPAALYYYGKILRATARTDEDRKKAIDMFVRAMQKDTANHAYGAYLHRAIYLIDNGSPEEKRQAVALLEQYVTKYAQAMDELNGAAGRRLPPHMDTIVDYMRRAGVEDWNPGLIKASASVPALPAPDNNKPDPPAAALPRATPPPVKKK